ncbi:hypothetical protein RRG08_004928 [Elysia crispata]|uniref:Uncharacterized protein n=1 Tax=Elysia crispata TaxID=231223 RepID=A0AAE0ZJ26_9GAST|nr:hypothetical protein RRG08_004928 [Elysia crispata]
MGILTASVNTAQTVIAKTEPSTPSSETFSTTTTSNPLVYLGNGHLSELGWLIPLVIGGVIAMVILALLCFYGVTALERKFTVFCFNTFGCCRPGPTRLGEESESLSRAYALKETQGYSSTSVFQLN